MRSRLDISISVGTLDLIECGPTEEEGQSPHDHIPLYFIAAPSTAARRPPAARSSQDASDVSAMSHSIRGRKRVIGSESRVDVDWGKVVSGAGAPGQSPPTATFNNMKKG
jgi:hypothetical protein